MVISNKVQILQCRQKVLNIYFFKSLGNINCVSRMKCKFGNFSFSCVSFKSLGIPFAELSERIVTLISVTFVILLRVLKLKNFYAKIKLGFSSRCALSPYSTQDDWDFLCNSWKSVGFTQISLVGRKL